MKTNKLLCEAKCRKHLIAICHNCGEFQIVLAHNWNAKKRKIKCELGNKLQCYECEAMIK